MRMRTLDPPVEDVTYGSFPSLEVRFKEDDELESFERSQYKISSPSILNTRTTSTLTHSHRSPYSRN
jgi:hypothetical protein